MDFSSFTYFSNIFCAVNLNVLGLKAYWYTGSAFTRFLNHIYLFSVITYTGSFYICRNKKLTLEYFTLYIRVLNRNFSKWVDTVKAFLYFHAGGGAK